MQSFPRGWTGADIVFLDCDSTLSAVEGIDELASRNGSDVATLTTDAMAGRVTMESVYRRRLELIDPGTDDLIWLADRYAQTVVPGAHELVAALVDLGIACHVVSGGLLPAVMPFAISLGIAAANVHAVPFPVDEEDPVGIASTHPLARNGGKPEVIAEACAEGPVRERRMLVGDGGSDLEAASSVGLFVGFGGVENREAVRAQSATFLSAEGLWAIGVLAAGPDRLAELEATAPELHHRAMIDFASPERMVIREP
jgi:phosphoserine phosphatase